MLRFEPVPSASEPCCLTQCAIGTIAITNVSEIIKMFGTTEIRTRTYCLRNFRPNVTAEIYFRIKRVGKNLVKKTTLRTE